MNIKQWIGLSGFCLMIYCQYYLVSTIDNEAKNLKRAVQNIHEQVLILDMQRNELQSLKIELARTNEAYIQLENKANAAVKENTKHRQFWNEYAGRVIVVGDPTEGFCYRPRVK